MIILAYRKIFFKFHNKVTVKKVKKQAPLTVLSVVLWTFSFHFMLYIYIGSTQISRAHMDIFLQYHSFVHATIRKLIRHPFAIFIIHRSCLKWTNGFSVKISLNIQFYRAFSTIHHRNKLVIFSLNIITSGDYRIRWIQQKRLSIHFKDLDNSGQAEILSSFYLQFDLFHRWVERRSNDIDAKKNLCYWKKNVEKNYF